MERKYWDTGPSVAFSMFGPGVDERPLTRPSPAKRGEGEPTLRQNCFSPPAGRRCRQADEGPLFVMIVHDAKRHGFT